MDAIVMLSAGETSLQQEPTPTPTPGSAVLRVLHSHVQKNSRDLMRAENAAGGVAMTQPYPVIAGVGAIARVAAAGPDAAALKPGQLVFYEPFVRARDDRNVAIIVGAYDGSDARTKKFALDNWHHGSWAEYVRAPLENIIPLNEQRLKTLGLAPQDLVQMGAMTVAYAALRKIGVHAGETVVVTPATGLYSGCVVAVARAIGAQVIAVGRTAAKLDELKAAFPGITTISLDATTNLTEAILAVGGPVDAVVDISPPHATGSTHLGDAINAVRRYGRVCLMGGRGDAALPVSFGAMVFKDLTVRGSWMYEREHVLDVVKMVETGALALGKKGGYEVVGKFGYNELDEALDKGLEVSATKMVLIGPAP